MLMSSMPPSLTSKTFYPLVVLSLAIDSFFSLTLGINLLAITISFTSKLLRAIDCSILWLLYHHSQLQDLPTQSHDIIPPLTELILHGCPPGLLLWVKDMLSLYNHISSTWNCSIACIAHGRDDPLSVVVPH